jgi:hypothetical protein
MRVPCLLLGCGVGVESPVAAQYSEIAEAEGGLPRYRGNNHWPTSAVASTTTLPFTCDHLGSNFFIWLWVRESIHYTMAVQPDQLHTSSVNYEGR